MKISGKTKILSLSWILFWFTASAIATSQNFSYDLSRTLQSPSVIPFSLFGYDAFGRDVLATVLQGSLVSGFFALFAVGLSCFAGISIGATLPFYPVFIRELFLRFLDFLLSFPSLLIALTLASIWGPGWSTLIVALCIGSVPPFVRLMYVRTQEVLREDYMLASLSLGGSQWQSALNHLVPPLIQLAKVKVPNLFASALLAEATLSFLGVGVPIGQLSWGAILAQGKEYLIEAPHLAVGSGIPLVLTVLSLQLVSENKPQDFTKKT